MRDACVVSDAAAAMTAPLSFRDGVCPIGGVAARGCGDLDALPGSGEHFPGYRVEFRHLRPGESFADRIGMVERHRGSQWRFETIPRQSRHL